MGLFQDIFNIGFILDQVFLIPFTWSPINFSGFVYHFANQSSDQVNLNSFFSMNLLYKYLAIYLKFNKKLWFSFPILLFNLIEIKSLLLIYLIKPMN
jgi:hypothetical protein